MVVVLVINDNPTTIYYLFTANLAAFFFYLAKNTYIPPSKQTSATRCKPRNLCKFGVFTLNVLWDLHKEFRCPLFLFCLSSVVCLWILLLFNVAFPRSQNGKRGAKDCNPTIQQSDKHSNFPPQPNTSNIYKYSEILRDKWICPARKQNTLYIIYLFVMHLINL